MATKRSILRRVRIPVVAPTKNPTKTTKKTRRPTTKRVAPQPSIKQRTDRTIAAIADRIQRVDTEYYEIGQALNTLDEPSIWQAYGETSFRGFLDEYVIPYTTARRMLTIAQSYTKQIAKAIGLERGFQLARLARIDPKIRRSAQQLWKQNAKLGKRKTPIRQLTATEVAALVQGALLRSKKRPKATKPTPTEKSALKQFKTEWKDLFDLRADINLDLKKRKVRIEFSLDELLEEE